MTDETTTTPTPDEPEPWPDRFLKELAATANVSLSARLAGIHRDTAYDRRSRDAGFARRWDDAVDQGVDEVEAAAFKFAREGCVSLITFLLSSHRPERYRPRAKVEHAHSGDVSVSVAPAAGTVSNALGILASLGFRTGPGDAVEGPGNPVLPPLADVPSVGLPPP